MTTNTITGTIPPVDHDPQYIWLDTSTPGTFIPKKWNPVTAQWVGLDGETFDGGGAFND